MFCIDTSYLLEIILSMIWKKREKIIWFSFFIIKTVTFSISNIFTCPIGFRHLKMLKRWVGKELYIWSNFVLTLKCDTLLKYAYIYIIYHTYIIYHIYIIYPSIYIPTICWKTGVLEILFIYEVGIRNWLNKLILTGRDRVLKEHFLHFR